MKIAIFCCFLALRLCFAVAESVPCEIIHEGNWNFPVGPQKTCDMTGTTVIDSPGVSISSTADASVGALSFYGNQKIKFLPQNPAEKFANLVLYYASSCSIETIKKENFKALSMLKELYLNHNMIEKVPSDVFEDLTALEVLYLEYNKIKFINSAAFRGLRNLRDIDFNGNVCVQGRYESATSIASMIPTLTDKCGFSESIKSNHKDQANTLNTLIHETKDEILISRNNNTKSFASIESEVKAAKAQIGQLQSENAKLQTQVQEMNLKLAESEKKQTKNALKMDKLQQTLDDAEMKTKFEQMKTLMEATSNQLQLSSNLSASYFDNCERENKNYAIEISVCKADLNTANIQTDDMKNVLNELDQCKREKNKFRDDFRSSNAKLQIYEGINITGLAEKISSVYNLLRNTTKP